MPDNHNILARLDALETAVLALIELQNGGSAGGYFTSSEAWTLKDAIETARNHPGTPTRADEQ